MTLRLWFGAAALVAALGLVPAAAQQPSLTSQPTADARPQQPNAVCTPADISTALPLLDRVQRLLDDALKDGGLGKVEMDRGAIDEMRAEIAQIRAAIQPPNSTRPQAPAAPR